MSKPIKHKDKTHAKTLLCPYAGINKNCEAEMCMSWVWVDDDVSSATYHIDGYCALINIDKE